jgi:hypothetical protein
MLKPHIASDSRGIFEVRLDMCIEIQPGLTSSSIDFDQLVGVESDLIITNENVSASAAYETGLEGPDIDFMLFSETGAQYPPMDISFPSLTNVSYLNLWGNISRLVLLSRFSGRLLMLYSSLDIPKLTTSIMAPGSKEYVATGIQVWSIGNGLNISLPSLTTAPELVLSGNFRRQEPHCVDRVIV